MIDLHSHILPGMDDGARDLEESLRMADLAVRSGVTAMVATPHCAGDRTEEVRESLAYLRAGLRSAGIPLRVYAGMEIFGSPYTAEMLQRGQLLTLAGSRYPLIEFDFESDGERETEVLQRVLQAGFVPLVAHPERYRYIRENPELINLWKRMGCLFQVNRGSLLGRFGPGARAMGLELTGRGFATVVASDAHSASMRTPWMGDIWEQLSRRFAPDAAVWLLRDNPRRILKNEQIPPAEPEWFV